MHPEKIGRYEIKGELGRGGMATVYRAYDPMFEREVALKVLPRELLHDPQFHGRFEREAKIIARLEHATIVPVYDVGDDNGQPFFVMRYMAGGTLSERMKTGPISLEETARIINRISAALDYAHSKGIIHRDLKPGNILFDEADDPFIADFGIAKLAHSQTNLTGSSVLGTPAYMSPEQAQGAEIDHRSDIYALGVIMYEMLSGKPPYESNTPIGLAFKHVTEPIPHILNVNPDLPPVIEAIIEKAMAKDPIRRFSSASTMASALNMAARGETPDLDYTTPMATRIRPGTHQEAAPIVGSEKPAQAAKMPWMWIAAAMGGILILLVAGLLLSRSFFAAPEPTTTSIPALPTETVFAPPTETLVSASPTPEPPAGIGGADKIGLLVANNLWVMEIDGANPIQLTTDSKPKSDLQWLPDGTGLAYMQDKCAYSIGLEDKKITRLVCFDTVKFFEGFRISPDGKQVAIVFERRLFIVPFDLQALAAVKDRSSLEALNGCLSYAGAAAKNSRWDSDGKRLALMFLLGNNNRVADTIRVMDVSQCGSDPLLIDEFPAKRFTLEGYNDNLLLPSYDWDGGNRFLMNTFKRNDGYGELYLYDLSNGIASKINPIEGSCCYRDARFSPDGKMLLFAFQDFRKGADSETLVYYIPFEQVGANAELTPLKLPPLFLTNPRDKLQFILRPAR